MALPWIIGGAIAAAIAAAVAASDDDDSPGRRDSEREIEARAEQKRKDAKLREDRKYCREKLKSFYNKYELTCSQETANLNKVIERIIDTGMADIEIEMEARYKESNAIRQLDKKIKSEQSFLKKLNDAEKFLENLWRDCDE